MNMPTPMSNRTYQKGATQVHGASVQAMKDSFQIAIQKVRTHCMKENPSVSDDSVIDIGVSYDGSWHRRGHSSHYGVGTIIELKQGL